ncbi:uncharacterized protein LOC133997320 isoform X2 [Scomber scombrus]|uniref:uncharacterized protein LOC133997320 isoform X2 n=1 Tax=Scomber scombrus TaxID=13677 RepID=UPI002DD91972|nr:uncharacterized protein LOC133997320 isoform X2 [Scomber scombrus]
MVEFKWIKISLFLIVLLQFRAVTGQDSYIIVRDGDSVTLPCKNVIKGQDKCNSTTWLYSRLESSPVVELINLGNITNDAKTKSDRLSVTADCSLVIKKVTVDDVGRYTCRQYDRSGKQQGPDARVHLSIINIYEQKDADDTMTLTCSVLNYGQCKHTVEWLYEGITDKLKETKGSCSATVTFKTSSVLDQKLFKCKVTESNGETRLCNFTPRTSCEKQGKSTETETTTKVDNNNNTSANNIGDPEKTLEWWWFLLGAVGLGILLIIVVVVVRQRRKPKGNKTKMDDGTVDAGDVSYASVSYTKKNDSKPRTHGDDDDEGDAVTYSTVKASSSSAGASTDPSSLYATVN